MMNLFENLQNMNENVLKLSNKELIRKYVNKLSDEEQEEYDVKNILANFDSLSEDDNVIEDLAITIQDILLDNEVDIEPATDRSSNWYIYNESVLKEYKSDINNKDELWDEMLRYTDNDPRVSFTDLFNCYSIDDLKDLYDFLLSEYEDDNEEETPYEIDLDNLTVLWGAMNNLPGFDDDSVKFEDLFNCYSMDKLKELYDFMSSEYSEVDDYDEEFENKQLTESNDVYDNRQKMDYVLDVIMSLDEYVNNADEISELLSKKITKLYQICSSLESNEEIKESTSGICGAYSTKAIDIKPE